MIKKIFKFILLTFSFAFVIIVLGLSVRGIPGNPNHATLGNPEIRDEGPLELSPERGRFALIYSVIEDKSFQFKLPVARFVAPDLGFKDGNYVSLFAPGVSFIAVPGYLIGRIFGLSQVGTYAEIAVFAFLNAILIFGIARRLGAQSTAATVAALTFLFATPAFAYAVTLYQHHITVFFLLSSIYILLTWKKLWSLLLVWIFVIGSVVIDYPNFFLFFPIGLYGVARMFSVKKSEGGYKLNFKVLGLLTFISAIIPVSFFLWSNKMSYGDPLQLAGTVKAVKVVDADGKPLFSEDLARLSGQEVTNDTPQKTAVGFFKTRKMLSGMYTHLVSSERGIIWYAPVILFGIIGAFILYKKKPDFAALILSVIGINLLLYSMWGDPWGGWAFGSRYLIPAYSLMAIFTAIALTEVKRKIFVLFIFYLVFAYSVFVNTLGALTTNKVPPKVEAVALEKTSNQKEEYTYMRNWNFLLNKGSKSFIYQSFAKNYLAPVEYFYILSATIILLAGGNLTFMYLSDRKKKL